MKKIFYFTLALALAAGVSSCKNEEDDIFDDTAANRLEQYKKDYANVFTDKGGKWALEYFANTEEPGYVFVVTFDKNGSVEVAGNNKWTPTSSMYSHRLRISSVVLPIPNLTIRISTKPVPVTKVTMSSS